MDRYLRPLAHVASHLRAALAQDASPPIRQAGPGSYDALISALAALPRSAPPCGLSVAGSAWSRAISAPR